MKFSSQAQHQDLPLQTKWRKKNQKESWMHPLERKSSNYKKDF